MDESTVLKVYEALARIIARQAGAVVVKVDIEKASAGQSLTGIPTEA